MARARTLKPGFFKNERLAECEPLARLLFEGLWCEADREGRLEDRPRRLKVEYLPYDDCDVVKLLDQLETRGFIVRYQVGEGEYIQILNFVKHQHPHPKEAASQLPARESHVITRQVPETPEPAGPSSFPSHSLDSEASASDAGASSPSAEVIPFDTKAAIFGEQLAWLRETTGKSEASLRSWLGKCCGQYGEPETLGAILHIRGSPTPVDPISRMRSILERQTGRNGTKSSDKLSPTDALFAGAAIALKRRAERERPGDSGPRFDPSQPLLDSG